MIVLAILMSCQEEEAPRQVDVSTETFEVADDGPTYHRDIAPILRGRCEGCHQPGGLASFAPWSDYLSVLPYAALIAREVDNRNMPPWGAEDTEDCADPKPWLGDLRLADADIQVIWDWVEAGVPEGDPSTAAALEPLPGAQAGLDTFDVELTLPVPYTVEESDIQVCFGLELGLTEDRYLEAVAFLPGNIEVVHHAAVRIGPRAAVENALNADGYYDCNGNQGPSMDDMDQVGGYLPGNNITVTPPGSGLLVRADSMVVLSVHYHRSQLDIPELPDQSTVQLRWVEEPDREARILRIPNFHPSKLLDGADDPTEGSAFFIPKDATDHIETYSTKIDVDNPDRLYQIWRIGVHMHNVGVRTTVTVVSQDRCLLDVPRYDFDWQMVYSYDTLDPGVPVLRGDDEVHIDCIYNNSDSNQRLMDILSDEHGLYETQDVEWGPDSNEEMCGLILGIVPI
jgi:hypothetical protein